MLMSMLIPKQPAGQGAVSQRRKRRPFRAKRGRETGARYRREILAVGGSCPALERFIAFRGREPEPAALLRSYGLAV